MYKKGGKRLMDITIASIAIVVLSPLFLIIVISLVWANRGKVFFTQTRPGWYERPFNVIKFKTMNDAKDQHGVLMPDNIRLTRLGKVIRNTSLDEIPQLINVIKGDMSLVGPRPLLFKYIHLYNETQRRRHDVRPGITGWAQVNGRNSIEWNQKFIFDIYYVDNLSCWFDLRILWITLVKVLKREGINQRKDMPMQPFTGNN